MSVLDLHPHFATYLQGLHGGFTKLRGDWNTIYTGFPGAGDVLHTPVTAADLKTHPSSFITPTALSTGANMNSSHYLSVPFLFSIRAEEGTAPDIDCDTNFTPTQGYSEGVMENAGGCQTQTKGSTKTCCHGSGNKMGCQRLNLV